MNLLGFCGNARACFAGSVAMYEGTVDERHIPKFRALDLTGDGTLSVRADDVQMFEVYSNMKEGGVEKSKHGPGVVVDFLETNETKARDGRQGKCV